MITQIQKHFKKTTLILAFLMLFLSLIASGEEEQGKCEEAFERCMIDALTYIPNFTLVYIHAIYCANGYAFCIKYIKK